MSWDVKIPKPAQRELDALPENIWQEAIEAIRELREDPFPEGCILLEGNVGLYRIRFYRGLYRIVYRVSEKQHRVVITRVRIRRNAYRGL